MLNDIDHIACKVKDIAKVVEAFRSIGIKCSEVESHDEVGLRTAFLNVNNTQVELLEVIHQNSPIQNDHFGYNHIAFRTRSVQETYEHIKKDERFSLQGEIQRGAKNRLIFFFRLIAEPNLVFECVEE